MYIRHTHTSDTYVIHTFHARSHTCTHLGCLTNTSRSVSLLFQGTYGNQSEIAAIWWRLPSRTGPTAVVQLVAVSRRKSFSLGDAPRVPNPSFERIVEHDIGPVPQFVGEIAEVDVDLLDRRSRRRPWVSR